MMAIIEGAILSTFLNQIVILFNKKIDEGKDKPQIVRVTQDPDDYSNSELEKVKTTNKKWTNKDKPLLKFDNILEKETIVKEVSLTPDETFRTKGKIIITVDDSTVFKSKTFDAFENLQDTLIAIRKTIQQDSKVKVFMISSDGSQVGMTVQVTFGE